MTERFALGARGGVSARFLALAVSARTMAVAATAPWWEREGIHSGWRCG